MVDGTGWRGQENGLTFGQRLLVLARDDPDERALGTPEMSNGLDVLKTGADDVLGLAVNDLGVGHVLL